MMALFTPWLLFACLSVAKLVLGRGKVIDIFDGKGDILQLNEPDGFHHDYASSVFLNAILSNSRRKWNLRDSNGNIVIPYVIGGGYEGYEINTIKQAMMRIEANTCIRFRPRSSEWDYIFIVNRDGEGCYTSVGRQNGRSILVLEANDDNTCMETHIVQHELLHVIGLWHEHMRYDRDQYITVFRQNIAPGYASQFKKISSSESTVYGLPYDYTSIMHYAKTAFAIPGTITMKTRDPRYMNVIGRQRDASRSDYLKVCQIYGCNQCNGEGTRPEGGEKCIDKFSQLCVVVKQHGLLDCNGNSKGYCCATCKAITQ